MGCRDVLLLAAALALAHAAVAATVSAPGGLSHQRTPQFVLLSHDDAVGGTTFDGMRAVTEGIVANGCPATATMFVTSSGTDCGLLADLYRRGWEVAVHTQTHPSLLKLGRPELSKELLGARTKLAQCGVPEAAIVGTRAPFLEIKKEVWEVLHGAGFLYDSTLIENTQGASVSGGMGDRVWPWDMGAGIPINCAWYANIQKCAGAGTFPGMWQIPLWSLSADGQAYTMDYGAGCSGRSCVYKILKANFDASYNGNRAPFPIAIHTYWLTQGTNQEQLRRFMDEIAQLPDVYFITMRQLLAWMKAPVAADAITPATAPALLGCGSPGGAGPASAARRSAAPIATRHALSPAAAPARVPAPAPAPADANGAEEEAPADGGGNNAEEQPAADEEQPAAEEPPPPPPKKKKKQQRRRKEDQPAPEEEEQPAPDAFDEQQPVDDVLFELGSSNWGWR